MSRSVPGSTTPRKMWEAFSESERELVTLALTEDALDWRDTARQRVGPERQEAIARQTCVEAAVRRLRVRTPVGWVVRLGFWYAPEAFADTPVDYADAHVFSTVWQANDRCRDLIEAGRSHPRCATVCRRYAKATPSRGS